MTEDDRCGVAAAGPVVHDGVTFTPDGYGGETATRCGVLAGLIQWDEVYLCHRAVRIAAGATAGDVNAWRRVRSLAEGRAYIASAAEPPFPAFAPPRRGRAG